MHFKNNNRKALTFPDSCNESCTTKMLPATHPALREITFVSALEWELALQWPEGKHLSMQKNYIWINHQEKKVIFRSTEDWLKYSLPEVKRGALEDFIKNALWQVGFDCAIQIQRRFNSCEAKLSCSLIWVVLVFRGFVCTVTCYWAGRHPNSCKRRVSWSETAAGFCPETGGGTLIHSVDKCAPRAEASSG